MGSVPMSDLVTIIIKAPNQQIADQIIQCHHSWTIKKLKDYLSEVYPSKPKMEEQKLIYSGKLLTDSAVLKDILRTYEGQENHTVHLVCTSKSQKFVKTPSSFSSKPTSNDSRPQISTSNSNQHQDTSQSRNTSSVNTNPGSVPVTGIHGPTLDQMNANQFNLNSFDPRYFWPSATAFSNLNDADTTQQYAYMQQAYAQYISQYMQMIGQPGLSYMPSHMPQFVGTSQTTPLPNNNDRPNAERNVARENQPGQPVVGAAGNDDDEENRNNRDWLDWFYVFSRVVVLFSVVYFYSTPLRLLAVSLLLCMFYLHQNMRVQNDHLNVHGNNNNNNNAVNQNNNQNNENRPDNRGNENPPVPLAPQQRTATDAESRPDATAEPANVRTEALVPPVPERPSPVTITLLAIRTFFLSLVPDHHVL